jgi:hypothetical protein
VEHHNQLNKLFKTGLGNFSFSHELIRVACSRVGKPSTLFMLRKYRLIKYIVHQLILSLIKTINVCTSKK